MNRQQVLEAYNVDPVNGIILSLGKFEGEMLYVPALWEQMMEGFADADLGQVFCAVIDDTDRAEFPELADTYGILMEELEVGFVMTEEFETKDEYHAAVARLREKESADATA